MIKWTYFCDIVEYPRLNKPEAWSQTADNKKTMFKSYPDFEFIPGTKGDLEPLRYGHFVIDIDTKDNAIKDALRIISFFESEYNVETDEWEIYLSGKKGVHLILSDVAFGLEKGHVLLPLIYKRIAKDIEGDVGVTLDCSMYNRGTGKPFRQPNILREDTQTYKVQITFDELEEITDDYNDLCSQPRELFKPNIKKNEILSNIVKQYAEILEKEEVKHEIELTQDQVEALKEVPACIRSLSSMTNFPPYCFPTFNDIAVQITAYAITAGFPENRFLSACSSFIYNYPSTSLTSAKKRLDNIVARYRNMAASGSYCHSCGGINSLGIKGLWNCHLCHYRRFNNLEKRISVEELKESSKTTFISDNLLNNRGLITDGLELACMLSGLDIVQYNFPVVLAHIATAIAGKIRYENIHPSFFMIKIGSTSTGKSDSDKAFKNIIAPHFEIKEHIDKKEIRRNTFYGANDYSSGPAIFRSISKNLQSLSILDEIKFFFEKNGKNHDPNTQSKIQAILELSTSAGQLYHKTYAVSDNDIVLEYPVINLMGNATEIIFDAFNLEDVESGLIQRFDFFCYDGKTPYRQKKNKDQIQDLIDVFVSKIVALRALSPLLYYYENHISFNPEITPAVNIGMETDAEELREEYSRHIIDEVNNTEEGGKRGIISRAYQNSIKLALVHAAATREANKENIFLPLKKNDVEWGIEVANILYKWKLNTLINNLSAGEFDKMCEIFLDACKIAVRNNLKPSGSVLINKKRKLKNLNTKQWDEIVKVLKARKQIIISDGSPTLYYPSK